MNPTKEELDAIESWLSMYPMAKGQTDAISTILTRYRDGELVEKDRWISVKDRLPEFGTPILYYRDSIGMQTTTWDREEEKYYVMNDITHWQPLPTPPTEPSNETK